MVDEGLGEWAGRCRDFSADRGLDCGALKAKLWQSHGVRPLIEPRELWREEKAMPGHDPARPITRALYPERADCIVYTGKGQVRCRCPSTGEERDLAFREFDPGRNALKYRCPAAAHDFVCEGRAACERMGGGQSGQYGRVVRIGLDRHDRRIFTPTPYGSPSWKRGYRRRAALERINARPDRSFEFEQHFIRGLSRMRARVGLALSVMMALALGHVRAGCPERMRSLYDPVPPASAGAGSGPTPADRLVPPQVSPGPVPRARACPRESGGPARARRPHQRILPFQERLMRGFPAFVGVDRAPSRRLQRPGTPRWRQPSARKPYSAHASKDERALQSGAGRDIDRLVGHLFGTGSRRCFPAPDYAQSSAEWFLSARHSRGSGNPGTFD